MNTTIGISIPVALGILLVLAFIIIGVLVLYAKKRRKNPPTDAIDASVLYTNNDSAMDNPVYMGVDSVDRLANSGELHFDPRSESNQHTYMSVPGMEGSTIFGNRFTESSEDLT